MACDSPRPESGWPVDPHVGKVLGGKYRVDSSSGAGGFGTVLLATQLHGQQDLGQVVLKILHTDLAQQDNVRRRFENEARAARQLGSPHAVKVFDLCYDDQGVPFIVMEYLEGVSLADELEEAERLPLERVLSIGQQVAEALAECHAKEIIHRDLKPDNILLLPGHREDFVKILDFGIARIPSPTGRVTQTLMGTPQYMSPEQIQQQPIDHRVDIFALGVILFESLAGTPPIDAPSHTETLARNCQEPPVRLRAVLPGAPEALDALIDQMMSKAAAHRPKDMTAVAEALEALEALEKAVPKGPLLDKAAGGSGAPTTGPKLTTLSASTGTQELARSLRASRRRPWMYVGLSAVALALIVGLGYWGLRPGAGEGVKSGTGGHGTPRSPSEDATVGRTPGGMGRVSITRLDGGVGAPDARSTAKSTTRPRQRPRRPRPRPAMRPPRAPATRPAMTPRPPPPRPPMDDPFGRVR